MSDRTRQERPLAILAGGLAVILAAAVAVIGYAYLDQANQTDELNCRVDRQGQTIDRQAGTIERLAAAAENTSESVSVIRALADAFAGLASPDPAVREEARQQLEAIRSAEDEVQRQEQGDAQDPADPRPEQPEESEEAEEPPPAATGTTTTAPPSSGTTTTAPPESLLPSIGPLPSITLPDLELAQVVPTTTTTDPDSC